MEPLLDRPDGRYIGHSDAPSDANGEGRLHMPEGLGLAGEDEAAAHESRASGYQHPRTEPVGEGPGEWSDAEQSKNCQREGGRHRCAGCSELVLKRGEEGAEGVGAPKTHGKDKEGANDYDPAATGVFSGSPGHLFEAIEACMPRLFHEIAPG